MIVLKIVITTVLFLHGFNYAQAQSSKIDSLNNLISKARSDTAKINLILKKISVISNINLDSAINLSLKTLAAAHAINYYKGEVNIRLKLATSYSFKSNYKAAAEQLSYLEKFIQPSKDSSDLANLYSNYGMLYGMQSKYDTSIQFLEKAISINEGGAGSKAALSGNYSNIAIGYQQQSNFPMALMYQQKSLKIAEENTDESSQAHTLVNIANTYVNLGDTTRAENAFMKSIVLAKKNQLKNVELYAYSNLSSMYVNGNKWRKSYEYAMKAAALGVAMGDQGMAAASLSKAALSLASLNQPENAKALSLRAIAAADSSANPLNIYQAYSSMGYALMYQKKWKEAIPFYEKSFAALKNADLYGLEYGKVFKELSVCYEKTGNITKALAAYKKYAEIKDSASSRDNIQKATELSMNYEFGKKEAVAKAQQDKKDVDAKRIKNQQYFTIAALGIVVLAVIIIAVIQFRNSMHKQKINLLLERQKSKVEITLSELKSAQAQLIQSEKMASLGELTAGIAHEIQNPLNFVNNFSEVNKELIAELKEGIEKGDWEEVKTIANDIEENEQKIIHHGKRADSIVKGMLQHSRTNTGKKELTNINALVGECLRLSYHGLRAKDKAFDATIQTNLDDRIYKINIVPQDISRVLINLLNNAFYAVNEKKRRLNGTFEPTVSACTKKLDGKVEIHVKDNGNGIPQNIVDKIFQPFFTTKPTGQGTGLGLSLSYDIIKAHGGEIKVESKEGEGSEFKIKLPLET